MVTTETGTALATASRAVVLHVIVNPAAGNGRAGKRWSRYASILADHGYSVVAQHTSGPGDATRLARELAQAGAETIVCVGGDGTVNEVVNGMIQDDRAVNPATRLALIPCGTGKDLARSLGTRTIEQTLTALGNGTTAIVDVGKVQYLDAHTGHLETRYFTNVADTGIGAATAARINSSSKALGGLVSYLKGAVHSIIVYKPWSAVVEVDGQQLFSGHAGMVVFANGRYFAGGMLVAPEASLCDGQLDIFVLDGVKKRVLLTSLLPRVYRGKHVGQPGVLHLRGASASVHSSDDMLVEMDGEEVGRAPVTVSVVPRLLPVIGDQRALQQVGGCTKASK